MKPSEVTKIPVSNIEPNPHNPRRLFDEEPMRILLESIGKVGVLVPITVYPLEAKDKVDISRDEFILLDGERRWRCARELGMDSIPAIIVERPTEVQNILTMFHIHNIREPWMLMPTALTLQALMERLGEENERKLSELTRLSVSQVRRCKILLSYPKKFQNMLLGPPSDRLKADFFIELRGIREPALREKYPFWVDRGDEECIDIFLRKYLQGVIKSVTEPRKILEIYRGALRIDALAEFSNEMVKFLGNPEMTIGDIYVHGASFEKEFKEIRRSAKRLLNQISPIDPEVISANLKMVRLLTKLANLIEAKLEQALATRTDYDGRKPT